MTMPDSILAWRMQLAQDLAAVSESPGLDAQVLIAHTLNSSRSWVLAHPEAVLSVAQVNFLSEARQALLQGKPLPYILGHWEFYGLDFLVTPDVLIPRPETELMVEQALQWLAQHPDASQVVDIGTGSGCIAVSLAARQPNIKIVAIDISPGAIEVARQNAHKHSVASRIEFILSDLLSAIEGCFELVCANLPYIPSAALQSLAVAQNEPLLALDGGLDGLDLIRRLFQQTPASLAKNSLLLAEIEAGQGNTARQVAQAVFPAAQISLLQDLSGRDRLLKIETRS
jgi:release factor glutamine methyltransferase